MRFRLASKVVLGGLFLTAAGLSPAAADTLAFGDPIFDTSASNVSETITFVATDATSTISFQGYQVPGYEIVSDVAVRLGGDGPNLLSSGWIAGTANSPFSWTFNDGSPVRGLGFGSLSAHFSDIFSQAVPTKIGGSYRLSFRYSDDPGVSGFLVTLTNGPLPGALVHNPGQSVHFFGQSGATAVPEPGTWALALLGFAALGYAHRNRKRGSAARCDA